MCVSQAEYGGATTFIDSKEIVKFLKVDNEINLLKDLYNKKIEFSKDKNSKCIEIIRKTSGDYKLNRTFIV